MGTTMPVNLRHGSSLRLPKMTRRKAAELAKSEGISLQDFVQIAVAEKLVRMESRISAEFWPCKQKTYRH